jgi:hypothetical protein
MRVVELSIHPGAMLRDTHQRGAAAEREARSLFEDALARHSGRVQAARGARDQARAQRRWWA